MEVREYEATEEVVRTVVAIEKLRCQQEISPHIAGAGKEHIGAAMRYAKEAVKHDIMEKLGDFIEITEPRPYLAMAKFSLPFVRNNVIRSFEAQVRGLESTLYSHQSEISALKGEIAWLTQPWYKRIFKKTE